MIFCNNINIFLREKTDFSCFKCVLLPKNLTHEELFLTENAMIKPRSNLYRIREKKRNFIWFLQLLTCRCSTNTLLRSRELRRNNKFILPDYQGRQLSMQQQTTNIFGSISNRSLTNIAISSWNQKAYHNFYQSPR